MFLPLLALLAGCVVGDLGPIVADDDDAVLVTDDDDDITKPVTPAEDIETVTFAISLDGIARPDPDRDQLVSELEGVAHILYWRDVDEADLVCRQRFDIAMIGVVGPAVPDLCEGCTGRIRVTESSMQPPDEQDGCGVLPPSVDLGFLVAPAEDTPASDFRQLDLIPWSELGGSVLTRDGLRPEDVEARYDALGLRAHYIAAIGPEGWLGEEAALGDVAQPWGEQQLLPMFVVYSNVDDGGDGESLDGSIYLSSLWRVGVGESIGATPAP